MAETALDLSIWHAYWTLCKPRVVALMLITAAVGLFMAAPGSVPLSLLLSSLTGIALVASSGAALNHILESEIDRGMKRTKKRPLPSGRLTLAQALTFACSMLTIGLAVLVLTVNVLTACLTFAAMVGYAIIYTVFLKPATPQNIVLGGLAGAMPPLLGWTSVTNSVDLGGVLLVLIIFTWTPPHFWALAIYRYEEYAKAKIPMLPVTHGIRHTKLNIMLYTLLLLPVSELPCVIGMSGLVYCIAAAMLGLWFLKMAIQLWRSDKRDQAFAVFRFSIVYLFVLFLALLADRYCYFAGSLLGLLLR